MNAILTRSVVQQAMSQLTRTIDFANSSSGRSPGAAPALGRYGFFYTAVLSESAPLETYQQPYQNVTHFPELVSAFGEQAFADYWS